MPLLFQTTSNHCYFTIHIFLCPVYTVVSSVALDLTESAFNTDSYVSAAECKRKTYPHGVVIVSAPIKIETPTPLPTNPGKSRAFGYFLFSGSGLFDG